MSWWNQRWIVVIVIVVGDDMSISSEISPMIRRGFLSALKESEVPLTGSKQEYSIQADRDGESSKFNFCFTAVMK